MKYIKNYTLKLFFFCVFTLLLTNPVLAVSNAGFETGDFTGWAQDGSNNEVGTTYAYAGTYGAKVVTPGAPAANIQQIVTIGDWLSLDRKIISTSTSDFKIYIETTEIYSESGASDWSRIYVNTSAFSGLNNIVFEGVSYDPGFEVWIDDVSTTQIPYADLSGYVHDNYGRPIGPAYLSIDLSGFTTESDDFGYYEINDIPTGNYLLTVTSGNNYDYTANISITADLEHNVTLTRLPPTIISGPSIIDSSVSSLKIGWTENSVTDSVKIYKDTNTNLIYTMDTAYTYINSYVATGLGIKTFYTFWIQPMDGTVSGLKYEISGTTGGADTFIPLPITTPTETSTPTPTDNETTIIDDIIEIITEILPEPLKELPEKIVEIVEETITYISMPFNWLLIITAYIGVFIGKSIFDEDEDYAEIITNTLLLGTIGWIVVLLINFFIPIISTNEIISIFIFTTSGFIIAAIASSIQPETKTRAPTRKH